MAASGFRYSATIDKTLFFEICNLLKADSFISIADNVEKLKNAIRQIQIISVRQI